MRKRPIPLPSQEMLRKLFRYDPESGKLFWATRPVEMFDGPSPRSAAHRQAVWNANNADREAFTALTQGYPHGTIFGHKVRAHRVIWKMVTGEEPDCIDHIDGNRANNRWNNLRSVTKADNSLNMARQSRSVRPYPGVVPNLKTGTWYARITKGGKVRFIGTFPTQDEAIAARLAAERQLGFHPNHGRRG